MQQVLLGAALLAALCWNLAQAGEIKGLQLTTGATGTRAEVQLDAKAEYKVTSLSGPDRLVLDLPGTDLGRGITAPAAAGIVKAVRTGHPQPGITRIVFDLETAVVALKPRLEPSDKGVSLVLEWPGDGGVDRLPVAASVESSPDETSSEQPATDPAASSAAATARLIAALPDVTAAKPAADNATERLIATLPGATTPSPPATAAAAPAAGSPSSPSSPSTSAIDALLAAGATAPAADTRSPVAAPSEPTSANTQAPVKTLQQVMRGRGMRPLIVAIDPGHGGQDPGAIGLKGKREKDVTLAIARELARQVNATPGLKAYMTRNSDVFIPLNRRAQLARAAKADIFLSIHADAAENRSANGSSVYVLSLKGASSQRARWLADKENAADLIGGVSLQKTSNMLASVLLDLTQSGHMKASEDAASHVLDSMGRVGHTRRVERANFAVLRTSDMPAMLVETAFISNPEEERRLSDPKYQRQLAAAVLSGVNTYFTRQPPPGTLYAARAAAASSSSSSAVAVGGGSP
ncbi:N-acetylmuramoyl-L-alanine amidase [Luteimonas cucumeris]|uniref:N-acetylmuramoyl-L-alanine amidase n=1 Tax=Luteimonas cucumeris TaxID=985012 RepID=UPI003CCD09B9